MDSKRIEPSYYKPFYIPWINEPIKVDDYFQHTVSIQSISSKESSKEVNII
jgi:hypothetical protein